MGADGFGGYKTHLEYVMGALTGWPSGPSIPQAAIMEGSIIPMEYPPPPGMGPEGVSPGGPGMEGPGPCICMPGGMAWGPGMGGPGMGGPFILDCGPGMGS